jgi:hypothetical protein
MVRQTVCVQEMMASQETIYNTTKAPRQRENFREGLRTVSHALG